MAETNRYYIKAIDIDDEGDVIVTFHDDPFDGEVILPAFTFEELAEQWLELRNQTG